MTPAHATLTVVGDARRQGCRPRAAPLRLHRLAAAWSASRHRNSAASRARSRSTSRPTSRMREVSIRQADRRQPSISSDGARLIALRFGGERTSWLFWKLVDEKKVARYVRARERSGAWASEFEVRIDGAPGHSAAEILSAFDASMDEICETGSLKPAIDEGVVRGHRPRVLVRELLDARVGVREILGSGRERGLCKPRLRSLRGHHARDRAGRRIEKRFPRNRRLAPFVNPADPSASAAGEKEGAPRRTRVRAAPSMGPGERKPEACLTRVARGMLTSHPTGRLLLRLPLPLRPRPPPLLPRGQSQALLPSTIRSGCIPWRRQRRHCSAARREREAAQRHPCLCGAHGFAVRGDRGHRGRRSAGHGG